MNDQIESLLVEEPLPKKNNVFWVFMILLIIGLTVFGLYKFTNIFKKSPKVIEEATALKLKEFTIEVGTELSMDINDYLTESNPDISNFSLDITSIPLNNFKVNKVGDYEYRIYNSNMKYKNTIHVIDTKKPVVNVKKLFITQDQVSNMTAKSFVVSSSDESGTVTISFNNNNIEKVNGLGKYNISIKGVDSSLNTTIVNTTLTVIQGDFLAKIYDLNASYNSLFDPDFNDEYVIKFFEGVSENSETYVSSIKSVNEYDWLNNVKNKYPNSISSNKIEVMNVYNQYGYIIGIAVKTTITIDNTEKKVFLVEN